MAAQMAERWEVVVEAGEGEVHGAAGAADGGLGFKDLDVEAGLGEDDGGGEAVGPGADDAGFGMAATGWGGIWHRVVEFRLRSSECRTCSGVLPACIQMEAHEAVGV